MHVIFVYLIARRNSSSETFMTGKNALIAFKSISRRFIDYKSFHFFKIVKPKNNVQ